MTNTQQHPPGHEPFSAAVALWIIVGVLVVVLVLVVVVSFARAASGCDGALVASVKPFGFACVREMP